MTYSQLSGRTSAIAGLFWNPCLWRAKESDWRTVGIDSRCPFYEGVRPKDVFVKFTLLSMRYLIKSILTITYSMCTSCATVCPSSTIIFFVQWVSLVWKETKYLLFSRIFPTSFKLSRPKRTVGSQFSYKKNGKPLNQLKDFLDRLISGKSALRRLANHILLKPFKYAT